MTKAKDANTHNNTMTCNLVIFGSTGDLALKKLFPALFALDAEGFLGKDMRIIASGRAKLDDDEFRAKAGHAIEEKFANEPKLAADHFYQRISYANVDIKNPNSFSVLKETLADDFARQETIYYLSTASNFFVEICQNLQKQDLTRANSKVILEKPIGTNLNTSQQINQAVGEIFDEENIYRTDHYLAKETVQNLLSLRFANALFEPVWNNAHIDNVQITVAETVGLAGRWSYYNESGALRDMIQNHLLQLLCLLAMEVPHKLTSNAVRFEKLKVLKSLASINPGDVALKTVRAQYIEGSVDGEKALAYNDEPDAKGESEIETFVALKAEINNWRWAGVPFYLRTGKRLPVRYSEIVIEFKEIPHSIFPSSSNMQSNKLVIRLQPEESIQMEMMNKVPGLVEGDMRLHPVTLNLSTPDKTANDRVPDAYERILFDVIRGNSTLFVQRDEVEAAWAWCDDILKGWKQSTSAPSTYQAGSSGPQAAFQLIARDGRSWYE